MKRSIIVLAGLILFPIAAFAQEEGGQPEPSTPAGNIACFDFYRFGSVKADLKPRSPRTAPGETMSFNGNITNENEYPLVAGTLSVKIFLQNNQTLQAGNGNEVVDQFVVAEGISLPAQGSMPVAFDWNVPINARGGEYYAAYFFDSSGYHLMGISSTEDIVGNQTPFTVINTAEVKTAQFLKNEITFNNQRYQSDANPLSFAAGDTVVARVKIQNPSQEIKTLPVQWNQYRVDVVRPENRQHTKTELITLAPGETKELSYEVMPSSGGVALITVSLQDGPSKHFLNLRFARVGDHNARLHFSGITNFPLQKDQAETVFACAKADDLSLVKDNVLILTLKDQEGDIISQYRYDGDINGLMGGFGQQFTPSKDYHYVKLEASLFQQGSEVEKTEIVYDCTQLDPNSCAGTNNNRGNIFSLRSTWIALGLIISLAVIGGIFYHRKRRSQPIQW